jgi:hypothetical protein
MRKAPRGTPPSPPAGERPGTPGERDRLGGHPQAPLAGCGAEYYEPHCPGTPRGSAGLAAEGGLDGGAAGEVGGVVKDGGQALEGDGLG